MLYGTASLLLPRMVPEMLLVLPMEPPPKGLTLLMPTPSGSLGTISGAVPRPTRGPGIDGLPPGLTRMVFGSTESGLWLSTFGALGTGPIIGVLSTGPGIALGTAGTGPVVVGVNTACAEPAPVPARSISAAARYLFMTVSMDCRSSPKGEANGTAAITPVRQASAKPASGRAGFYSSLSVIAIFANITYLGRKISICRIRRAPVHIATTETASRRKGNVKRTIPTGRRF